MSERWRFQRLPEVNCCVADVKVSGDKGLVLQQKKKETFSKTFQIYIGVFG